MKKIATIVMLVLLIASCKKSKTETTLYDINANTSVAEWKGATPHHFHTGSFEVQGLIRSHANGLVTGGTIVIPIASIKNYDLPDTVKPQLLNHLKSPDFFNMALHPAAAFKITKVIPFSGTDTAAIADANYLVTGDFRMLGNTHALTFPVKITYTTDSLKAEALLKLDRTKWGMTSFTDASKDLYILPEVALHLKIQAARKTN